MGQPNYCLWDSLRLPHNCYLWKRLQQKHTLAGLEMNRAAMNAALKERFVPLLRTRGFTGSLPHFRRRRGDQLDLLMVQFDKWGGGFVVEIGQCPADGITTYWDEYVPPGKVTVGYLSTESRHRLGSPSPGQDGLWFRFDEGISPSAVADRAASMLNEADGWWLAR